MIPRKIHYCWFGKKPLPLQAKCCLASWRYRLPDYELFCWDESCFDPMAHHFTAAAYQSGYFAFVADYVRMFALNIHGGIYLDVDVEVLSSFDDLLEKDFFIGLEDEKRFATAVIAAMAEHWLAKSMLEFYDRTVFDKHSLSQMVNVNEVSRLLIKHGFSGRGHEELENECVLEIGILAAAKAAGHRVPSKPLCRHHYAASWKINNKSMVSHAWRQLRKSPALIEAYFAWQAYRIKCFYREGNDR